MTASNADGMIHARRRDSDTKRARVHTTLHQMLEAGTPITFAAVARRAQVSTWLVYAPGVRDTIESARTQQNNETPAPPHDRDDSRALETDLALARAEITRLRAERDQQQQQLRHALGARMDNLAKADLLARVDELTRHNHELTAVSEQHRTDNDRLQARVTELEDDLAAARTSLRRMIRADNRTTQN